MDAYNHTGLLRAVLAQVCGAEIRKTKFAKGMSKQDTWKIRDFITFGGSPVCNSAFLGLSDVANGLFFVFGLTFGQTQCTVVKISVQQRKAETFCQNFGITPSAMNNDVILMLSVVCDIAIVVVSLTECPDSEFNLESHLKDPKRVRNTTPTGDDKETVFLDAILPVACQACPRTQQPRHTCGRYERHISPVEYFCAATTLSSRRRMTCLRRFS